MKKTNHKHHPVSSQTRGFSGCVNPSKCNPAAHGGCQLVKVCKCGATCIVNANGKNVERGPWVEPEQL
jgi:hypothetical protein